MHTLVNLQHIHQQNDNRFSETKVSISQKGFTLVELMIVVVIIGVLASIAIPSYSESVKRSKVAEATSNLANLKNRMEQYFQDNKTYLDTGGLTAPCSPAAAEAQFFNYACSTQTATTFTITATPVSGKGIDDFSFTINEANVKTSVFDGTTGSSCWLNAKGGSC